MTAPVDTSLITQISSSISAIQARIATIARIGSNVTTTSSSTSGSDFASVMSGAVSSYGTSSGVSSFGVAATGGSSSVAGGSVTGNDVVADAQKYLGIPYVWGGEDTTGMDCSGLVQRTFKDLGIDLPRTAAEQQQVGTAVPSLSQAQPGDLVFFGNPAYHVAIYLGNDQILQAPQSGENVSIAHLTETPTSIRRIATGTSTSTYGMSSAGLSAAGLSVAGLAGSGLSSSQITGSGLNSAVASYAVQFAAAEKKYNLPTGMLAAVAQQESGGNASAVSPAGAEGLMQLMPSTAASHGVNAFDPSQAIDAAASILSGNLKQFGSVQLALAAYNAGAGAVQQYGGIPPYTETQNYVRSITAMMGRLA
jgi:cell wall-associated NlpC family hydrolase